MSFFNDMSGNLEKINNAIESSIIKYGKTNIKKTYLHHLKLITTWKEYGRSEVLNESVNELFQSLFSNLKLKDKDYLLSPSDKIYHITEGDFYSMYTKDELSLMGEITGKSYDFSNLIGITNGFNKYPYIITASNDARIYCKPQSMRRSLLGVLDEDFYPSHAHIASAYGLKVKCAGELSVVWPRGNKYPLVIILNNISGHFLPKYVDCDWLHDFVRESMTNNSCTCVITFTNNGFKIN